MRVVLVSTYELGHQPLHVASPAAALRNAGHDVRCLDLSVQCLDLDVMGWADAVAFSVPMHTAMRLARAAAAEIRAAHPELPLWMYGLYAGLDGAEGSPPVADLRLSGEYEGELLAAAAGLTDTATATAAGDAADTDNDAPVDAVSSTRVSLGRGRFATPARQLLPGLEQYAKLAAHGTEVLAGYTEASHGCAHHCRHCPVPVVYDGRTRLVALDTVLADVEQMATSGARHITFGDPDFLNGPHHARRVVDAVHGAFPHLTFDITVKVEHVLRHGDLWSDFATAGCIFVVSAFESASDTVLGHLRKGHTVADEGEAVSVLRRAGIEPRPSLVPFTPWTTAPDMVRLIDLVDAWDLVGNVDPVQYAIRLLVPPGSLLLDSGALDGHLDGYDPEQLGWTWHAADARLDVVAAELGALAERAGAEGWSAMHSFDEVRALVTHRLADPTTASAARSYRQLDGARHVQRSSLAPDDRPRLTESWFCCAEPTQGQLASMRAAGPAVVGS